MLTCYYITACAPQNTEKGEYLLNNDIYHYLVNTPQKLDKTKE
jgi:hypothetical protein